MLLKMENICKDYPMGKSMLRVLKDACLQVEEGDYLAIMGPSGSGKTTLMNIIGCLDTPACGTYELAGRDITACSDDQLADVRNREIGFVFQSFNLMPKMTALENVALPLLYRGIKKEERLRLAREALTRVGLEDRVDFTPDRLSGGQCQRVAIARAIVGKPRLLLADEPTGALDSASGEQVMDLFRSLHEEGATIIMITHDRSVADHAVRQAYIRDGILTNGLPASDGTPNSLPLEGRVSGAAGAVSLPLEGKGDRRQAVDEVPDQHHLPLNGTPNPAAAEGSLVQRELSAKLTEGLSSPTDLSLNGTTPEGGASHV